MTELQTNLFLLMHLAICFLLLVILCGIVDDLCTTKIIMMTVLSVFLVSDKKCLFVELTVK